MLKITSMCSTRFGVLECVECKPVTFSCSGWLDQGNEPCRETCSVSELQFPLGQHTSNCKCTKELVLSKLLGAHRYVKTWNRCYGQSINGGWGDTIPCKKQESIEYWGRPGPRSLGLGIRFLFSKPLELNYPRHWNCSCVPFLPARQERTIFRYLLF